MMRAELSEEEEQLIHALLTWDQTRRPAERLLYNFFLFLGGAIIVIHGFLTVQQLHDRMVFWVTVPGFVLGLVFTLLYIIGERRIRERRRVAKVLRKLWGGLSLLCEADGLRKYSCGHTRCTVHGTRNYIEGPESLR